MTKLWDDKILFTFEFDESEEGEPMTMVLIAHFIYSIIIWATQVRQKEWMNVA